MSPAPMPQPAIGTTVTLSVETPVGPIGVVGVLVAATPERWSVRRRDGSVIEVDVVKITTGRVVPSSRAELVSVADLQRVAALGWRALEVEALGAWLLRAGGGFTGRANSALAVDDPGVPLAEAVDVVSSWYAERGLAPRIQIPDGAAPMGLEALLDQLGWERSPGVHVMTAEIGHVLRAGGAAADSDALVRLDPTPDDAWLSAYRQDGGALPPTAHEILVNHDSVVFASIRDGDRAVAIARAAVDGRWAGLFAVEVAPEHRGRGLGTTISTVALRWAGEHGARRTYLQVAADNAPAVRLYERLNFRIHHAYRYRTAPS